MPRIKLSEMEYQMPRIPSAFATWTKLQSASMLNIVNVISITSAFLCFLPQILGFNFDNDGYLNELLVLSESEMYKYSLVASVAANIPLLLENTIHHITNIYFRSKSLSSENEIIYFRFSICILCLVLLTDLLLLAYILPYHVFASLPGLIGCRDILFTWSFLINLHQLGGPIWTLPKIVIIMCSSILLNWIFWILVWTQFSESILNNTALLYIQYVLIITVLSLVLYVTAQWFYFLLFQTNLENLDLQTILKNIQTSIFAIFLCIYIFIDFAPGLLLVSSESTSWNAYGESYLTVLSYMMASCVLVVNIVTTSISKIGTLEISKKLLAERKMFMRYISHEIRTPLNTTFLGMNILKRELKSEFHNKPHRCFKTLRDTQVSCDIAVSILNDMLLYDKVESGSLKLELDIICPWSFFKTAVEPFYKQARDADIKILIEIHVPISPYPCTIKADFQQLSQVVRNLVSNAIKFSEEQSCIKIVVDLINSTTLKSLCSNITTTSSSSSSFNRSSNSNSSKLKNVKSTTAEDENVSYVRFSVSDTGVGISKLNQTKLFRGIIQFSPGKLQAGKGTGLGLYISKGIIEKHNGHIWVESAGEGFGSTFSVVIPIQEHLAPPEMDSCTFENNEGSRFTRQSSPRRHYSIDSNSECDNNHYSDTPFKLLSLNHQKVESFQEKLQFSPDNVYHFDSDNNNVPENSELEFFPSSKNMSSKYYYTATTNTITTAASAAVNYDGVSVLKTPPLMNYQFNKSDLFEESSNTSSDFEIEDSQATNTATSTTVAVVNVLVVDDSSACRMMTRRSLLGCPDKRFIVCCDQASDGKYASEMVSHIMNKSSTDLTSNIRRSKLVSLKSTCLSVYDVILMDYQMPNMDGPTAIREIRALGFKGRIVGLTGNVLPEDINTMTTSGADQVLTKPVAAEALENVLVSVFNERIAKHI